MSAISNAKLNQAYRANMQGSDVQGLLSQLVEDNYMPIMMCLFRWDVFNSCLLVTTSSLSIYVGMLSALPV